MGWLRPLSHIGATEWGNAGPIHGVIGARSKAQELRASRSGPASPAVEQRPFRPGQTRIMPVNNCKGLVYASGRSPNACRLLELAAKPRTFCPCESEHSPARQRLCCATKVELGRGTGRDAAGRRFTAFDLERTRKLTMRKSPPSTSSTTGSGVLRASTEAHERKLLRFACIAALPCGNNVEQRAIQRKSDTPGPDFRPISRRFVHPPRQRQWSLVPRHGDFRHPRLPSRRPMRSPVVDKIEGRKPIPSKGWA
jgi:hypothetical protein